MATDVRSIKMPGGEIVKIRVPSEWGAAEIRQEMVNRGMLSGEPTETQDALETPVAGTPAPTAERRPLGDELIRQAGLTGRTVLSGLAATPALVGDAANSLLNLIPGVSLTPASAGFKMLIDKTGLPEPESRTEKAVALIGEVVSATGGGIAGVSKTFTGPLAKTLTERAGTQLGGAVGVGGALVGAEEAELGLMGTMGVGLLGAFGGATATAQSSRMFGKWVQGRMRVNKPIDSSEVRQVAEDAGIPELAAAKETDDNVTALTEQLQELQVQAKIADKVEVKKAQLAPKTGDTVEQARLKRRELDKLGGKGQTVEQRRTAEALRRRDIQKAEQAVRREQAAQAAKESTVKAVETKSNRVEKNISLALTGANARASSSPAPAAPVPTGVAKRILRPDPDVPKDSAGRLLARDRFGNDLVAVIEKIAPRMAMEVRKVTMSGRSRASAAVKESLKFFDDPRYAKMKGPERAELDRAIKNVDDPVARAHRDAILDRHGLKASFNEHVAGPLERAGMKLSQQGAKIIEGGRFWPRVVRDVAALRKEFNRANPQGGFSQQLADAERKSQRERGHGLNPNEVASVINRLLHGRNTKLDKGRRIGNISSRHVKHYENPRDEFADYMHRFHHEQATRNFFKDVLRQEMPPGQQRVNETNLGELLAHSINAEKGLSSGQAAELAELLNIHFGVSRLGMSKGKTAAKNIGLAATLGSPSSTLTQLVDVAPVMARFGVLNTLQAMTPGARRVLKDVNAYNVGVRELSKELRTNRGTARVLDRVLRATGFHGLDRILSDVGLRAAYLKWTRAARKNRHQTKKELDKRFGENTEQLVADLQAGRLTDDVKTLMLNQTGKIRPVSREDMPIDWARNPEGRWRYSLLSWTLKQLNAQRNDAMRDWRSGNRKRAVRNITKLMFALAVAGGSVNTAKDFLVGREVDPLSNMVTGMFSMGMAGKYITDGLESHAPERALGAIVPAYGIMAQAGAKVYQSVADLDLSKLTDISPATRNWKGLLTGDVVGLAGEVAGAGVRAITGSSPSRGNNPLLNATVQPQAAPATQAAVAPQARPAPVFGPERGVPALVDRIVLGEGTNDARARREGFASGYDVPYAYGRHGMPEKPLTEMTLAEVQDFQKEQIRATRGLIPGTKQGTGAVGKYQFTFGTLRALAKLEGLVASTKFSPEVQDQLVTRRLKQRGLGKFLEGKISEDTLLDNLADEWASIGKADGRSAHGQAVGTKRSQLRALLRRMKGK